MVMGDRVEVHFIRNISVSGVFIESVDSYNTGDEVYLLFPLHHPEKTSRVSGRVVRMVGASNDSEYVIPGIGVEFVNSGFDFSVLVEDYIIRIKNIYEELLILIEMQNPDMKRLGTLVRKARLTGYGDFFELREKIRRDSLSMGILNKSAEE